MSFSTPPSAANASVTPPKTHSSGKWLANYDNPAKRVKTYDSPTPTVSHEENAKSQANRASPPKSAGTVPAFDFSPIDNFPQEIAQPALPTQPEAGSYLSNLIQDNFGSNTALESDSLLQEFNRSEDHAAKNDFSPSKLSSDTPAKSAIDANIEFTSIDSVPHRQGSTNASVASDITVPNTFDSLFKDNMEFTMPEDTMRAGMLAAALDLKNRAALEAMSPVNISPINNAEETITESAAIQSSLTPEANQDVESNKLESETTNAPDVLPTNSKTAAVDAEDHQPRSAEDNPSLLPSHSATTTSPGPDTTMNEAEPSTTSPAVESVSDTTKENPAAQEARPVSPLENAASNGPPTTPVRKPRKLAKTPQTAPRAIREPATPLSKSARPIPSTESQAGRMSKKSRVNPLDQVTETETGEQANKTPLAPRTAAQRKAENAATPVVFKTPAKAGRGTIVDKKRIEITAQEDVNKNEPQAPSAKNGDPVPETIETTKTEDPKVSTPHSQELASAKRSVRRSSQRITDTPVTDPQPTPTKSSSKVFVNDSPGAGNSAAPFSSPAAPRSSRSRQSDAPASIPKSQEERTPIAESSLSPLPAVTDRESDVLMEGNDDEKPDEIAEPAAQPAQTPTKLTSSPLAPKSTRKSAKKGPSTPLRNSKEDSINGTVSKEAENAADPALSVPSSRRSVRNRGLSQSTPKKSATSNNDEANAEHFTVEDDSVPEAKSTRGRNTRKAPSAEPAEAPTSPRSKKRKTAAPKTTVSAGTKRKKADVSEAAADSTTDQAEQTQEEEQPAAEETVPKATRGRRKAADPVNEAPTKARATRKKAEPVPAEPEEAAATAGKAKASTKAAAAPRASKRKAMATTEEEEEGEPTTKETEADDAPVEPPTKKARGRRAAAAAKDPTPEPAAAAAAPPTKTTRGKGAKNAVVASPKTTRGTTKTTTTTTRSTRSKK